MYANVYVVDVSLNLIAGTHSITEADLGLSPGTLPPDDLATLGNLWVVNKKLLDTGKALRAKTKRLLASVGVKVGCGTVVTAADLQDLTDSLEAIKTEFYDWKDTFVSSFESELDDWVSAHPEYADLIRRYAPDLKRVERRLSYHIDVYKFAVPPSDPNHQVLEKTLKRSGNDISKRLLREIADFCADSHMGSIQKSGRLVKQNLGPLRDTLLPKIKSFQLLDSSLSAVSSHLESFLCDVSSFIDSQPKGEKYLKGSDLVPFEERLSRLCSVTTIEQLISASPKRSSVSFPTASTNETPASSSKDSANSQTPARPSAPAAPSSPTDRIHDRPVNF